MTPAIAVAGLVKVYPGSAAPAVDGIDFTVSAGETVGLLGPNGAGKTTLLKLICGASPPTAGRVLVYGRPPDADAKRDVAVVHQSAPFDMMLTVRDNLRVAAAFRGLRWSRVRRRVDELLELFDLAGREDQLVFTLSGGQQRRLQVVRALLRVPKVLLLDEPSAGLDVSGRRRIWATLDDLRRRHAITLVLTSHYLEEVERNCARVLVIDRGRIVRDGSPAALREERGDVRARLRPGSPLDRPVIAERAREFGLDVGEDGEHVVLSGPELRQRVPALLADLAGRQVLIESMEVVTASLEDAFVALTGQEVGSR